MSARGRLAPRAFVAAAIVATLALRTAAVARLPSADGQFWDVQDTSPWAQDSGGIATGGRANPFDGFGYLKLRVRAAGGTLVPHQYLVGFGLAHDGGEHLDSITPVMYGDVVVSRGLFAPAAADYLRYVDSYTNTATDDRMIDVAWGGAAGAYEDGGRVTVAASSNGDAAIDLNDTFVTVMQNANRVADPAHGPSGHGPSAHVLGSHAAGLLTAVGDMYGDPFVNRWPGYDPAHIGYVFTLDRETWSDRRAHDLRRQGTERGLRSARRISRFRCATPWWRRNTRHRTQAPRRRFPRRDPRSRASPASPVRWSPRRTFTV